MLIQAPKSTKSRKHLEYKLRPPAKQVVLTIRFNLIFYDNYFLILYLSAPPIINAMHRAGNQYKLQSFCRWRKAFACRKLLADMDAMAPISSIYNNSWHLSVILFNISTSFLAVAFKSVSSFVRLKVVMGNPSS